MKKKMFVLSLLSCFLFVQSCTKSEKIKYVTENGVWHSTAFKEVDGYVKHLSDGKASFYIDCSGEYDEISKYAIEKIQKFTSLKNVKTTSKSNSDFKFTVYYADDGNNAITTTPSSYLITYGTIKYNTKNMDNDSKATKRSTALHEMGHILGLRDIYDENLRDYTVMWYSEGAFSDYTELDIENIIWCYGGSHK